MARMIQGVAKRSVLLSVNFPGRFSVVHVKDLAEGTVRLAFSDQWKNEIFHICSEPPHTLREITREIANQLGVSLTERNLPRLFYKVANGIVSGMTHVPGLGRLVPFQLLMLLRDQAALSSEKAKDRAGFQARISLSEGLRETIPWVLEDRKR